MIKKILGWLLVAHGIICILGAFFPFYPPVFLFFWFSRIHFAINLIIVLVLGASQIVFGIYLVLKKNGQANKVVLAGYYNYYSRFTSPGFSYPRRAFHPFLVRANS